MLKQTLSKLNFFISRNPKIDALNQNATFIPKPYKSVLLISTDFELAWAWRYSKSYPNPLKFAYQKAKSERKNIPLIVDLCKKFNIPITWMTVGHLFLESCNYENKIAHPHIPRLPHFENDYCKFSENDWFEHDPCSNFRDAPEWYCPDLIKLIIESKVKHEIGCHTFSHIDCRDKICPPDVIKTELKECKRLAREVGIELKSFVHPGHTIGNLDVLAEEGFTNFRTDYGNVLGYPTKHENGLWEFEPTAEFVYRNDWSLDYHIYRYTKIIKRAINKNKVCVFWFHPSCDEKLVNSVFPELFRYIRHLTDKGLIWLTTQGQYVDYLNRAK